MLPTLILAATVVGHPAPPPMIFTDPRPAQISAPAPRIRPQSAVPAPRVRPQDIGPAPRVRPQSGVAAPFVMRDAVTPYQERPPVYNPGYLYPYPGYARVGYFYPGGVPALFVGEVPVCTDLIYDADTLLTPLYCYEYGAGCCPDTPLRPY